MKHLSILIFATSFLLLSLQGNAENPCGVMYPVNDSTAWGLGFIRIPANSADFIRGVTVKEGKECFVGGKISFDNNNRPEIVPADYVWLGGYEFLLLKVYEISGTRYKICTNTIKGGIWVEFDELSNQGISFTTYLSFLCRNRNFVTYKAGFNPNHINIGVNLLHGCLNLRVEPSLKGKVITCIKANSQETYNNHTHIEMLNSNSNGWAEVLVRDYVLEKTDEEEIGCNFKVVKEYKGFLKILDEKGRPNIWYAVSAY
jgi:hypothetical protein